MNGSTPRAPHGPANDRTAIAWVGAAAVVSSIAGVANDFVQDDLYLIRDNERIHDFWNWKEIVSSPFWPAPLSQDLYRPVTSLLHAAEFGWGGGAPIVFRLVSYLLYAAACVGLFILARRLLARGIAFGMAILFAVHPVHTEAVALAAGQAELLVGVLATCMTLLYVTKRRGNGLRGRDWAALVAMYVLGCLTKEQGFVLPGLLVAAEVCLVHDDLADRVRTLWRGYAMLAGAGVLALLLRRSVLGGDVAGTFTAEALQGLGVGGRALTMLAVVPQWLRLLLWPAHLSIDYSPQQMVASTSFGAPEALGAFLLVAALAAAWFARRRAPVVTFGLLWCAVSLLPVSNVLIPTGILLAERTLFLPSMGLCLAIGGAVVAVVPWKDTDGSTRMWYALQTACIALALLGMLRSAERQRIWRNEAVLSVRSVQDAPLSFRTQRAYGDVLFQLGRRGLAEQAYQRSLALAPKGSVWRVRNALARHYRALDDHAREAEQIEQSLLEEPNQPDARGYLIAARLAMGDYSRASQEADIALAQGGNHQVFSGLRALADSAQRVAAPPGSVRVGIRTTPRGVRR